MISPLPLEVKKIEFDLDAFTPDYYTLE
jgi:hypothetical protein